MLSPSLFSIHRDTWIADENPNRPFEKDQIGKVMTILHGLLQYLA